MSVAGLTAALGADLVRQHEPLALEGAKLEATVRPRDGETLGEALRVLSAEGLGVLMRGGGSRLATANAPCRARVLLDTTGLDFTPELDADEGVMRCAAGTRLVKLHEHLAGSGWELPLAPPGAAATVGGTLAAAAVGPRWALPRDAVLGLGMALADGERIRCGGRVVKNVTGYDLAKLFVGSFGSHGVIEWAWLRLRPAPEATRVVIAAASPGEPAGVLAAARRPSVRAAVLAPTGRLDANEPAPRLLLELAGDAPAVAEDASWLEAKYGAREAGPAALAALREAQAEGPLCVRLAVLPTALAEATAPLTAAGAEVLAHPARGLAWARFDLGGPDDEAGVDRALAAATRSVRLTGGAYRIEAAPLAARTAREVFGGAEDTLALERALKAQYDPQGILNPGRFVGGM